MAPMSKPLGSLAALVGGTLHGDPATPIRDVTHDSRQAGVAALFVAVPGRRVDGHDFVGDAVATGAAAVVVEHPVDTRLPQLQVGDSRAAMGPLAAAVHDHPSQRVAVVGVTGTNGKTTVTHMVEAIARAAGRSVGLIGTVHTRIGRVSIPNARTTPEASDFQRLLSIMVERGASLVVCEVSSHALALRRVDATSFAVGAFTNLTHDHLDFHGGMEAYYQAKRRLFHPDVLAQAVIMVDDPWGARLAAETRVPVLAVGREGDIRAEGREAGLAAAAFDLVTPEGRRRITMALGGRFNVANAVVAAGCALAAGMTFDDVARGLEGFGGLPGRFELVSGDDPVRVLVDYAHTPEGIEEAIGSAREAGAERVLVVFGAGGDRDRAKRPEMGAAAGMADMAFVTSDNPRNEDPAAIIDEVRAGMGGEAVFEPDRRRAIGLAVAAARPGDAVLVLGKGHERGQEVAGRSLPFDDRLVARQLLDDRRRREGAG